MKIKIMLVIACAITTNSYAQTLLGTSSVDSVLLKSSNIDRLKIRAAGQACFHGAPFTFNNQGSTGTASVAMQLRTGDNINLLISDNAAAWLKPAHLAIANYYSPHAIYVMNERYNANPLASEDNGYVSEGGNGGYWRINYIGTSSYQFRGYECYNQVTNAASGINAISFVSGGNYETGVTPTNIVDYAAENWGASDNITVASTTRVGLHIAFTKQKFSTAWGVYQSDGEVKNHFNGATLFGSTTDNTYDKAQVTGGTKTDALATGIRQVSVNTTAASTDHTILVDASSAGATVTITLPVASTTTGKMFAIKKIDTSTNTVRVQPASGQIDGAPYKDLIGGMDGVLVQFDGTNYYILANN